MTHSLAPKPRPRGRLQMQSEQIAQDYLKMQAMLSYVSDVVIPFKAKRSSRPGDPVKRGEMLQDKQLYSAAVREAVLMWSPLLGLNIPNWAHHSKDAGLALQTAVRGSGGSAALTDARPPPPQGPPPGVARAPEGISAKKVAVLRSVLADQQKLQAEEDIALEGVKSILLSKQTLQKLLKQQRSLKLQSKDSLRKLVLHQSCSIVYVVTFLSNVQDIGCALNE